MVKIVTLFLIGMLILALLGRLRLPGMKNRRGGSGASLPKPRLCPDCGRYNLKGGTCSRCTKGRD